MAEKTVRLDGREFEKVGQALTMAQDDYILVTIADCNASEIIREIGALKHETNVEVKIKKYQDLGRTLLTAILRSGQAANLLAGLLTEKGMKWTRREAIKNALRFEDVKDEGEKVAMRETIVEFVFGFFPSGGALSTTSPKSSPQNEKAPATTNEEVVISASLPELSAK